MADVRNYGYRRRKAPKNLFSLHEPASVKVGNGRKKKRAQLRAQKKWARYVQSLRDKDLHRQRIEAENAAVPF